MGAGVGKVKRKMNRAINVVWVGDLQDGDIILIRHLSVPLLDRWSIHPETARGVIASSQGEFSLTRFYFYFLLGNGILSALCVCVCFFFCKIS